MVTRAIIEEIVETNKYRVRIPTLNRSEYSPLGTSFDNLYIATVSMMPNCKPNFQIGDAVFVAFENNSESKPVIIGQLLRDENTSLNPIINCDSISITSGAQLPYTTSIGGVTPSEIECLKGINKNLQFQLEILEQRIAKLEEKIKNSQGE